MPAPWAFDADADGHGNAQIPMAVSCAPPASCPPMLPSCDLRRWIRGIPNDDCDDNDHDVHPGAWDGPKYTPRSTGYKFPGLTATYRSSSSSTTIIRIDTSIAFEWGFSEPIAGISTSFSVVWDGVLVTVAGTYKFCAYGDDTLDIDVDGRRVLTDGRDTPSVSCASVSLTAGDHTFRAALNNSTGYSNAALSWERPGGATSENIATTTNPTFVAHPQACFDNRDQDCNGSADDGRVDDGDVTCDCRQPCPTDR